MSTFEVNAPYITGVPGRTRCASTTPNSASAFCCASAAAIDTGAIAPISVNGVTRHGLTVRRDRHQPLGHRLVESARAVDRNDRDDTGTARELGQGNASAIAIMRIPSSARPAPMAVQ